MSPSEEKKKVLRFAELTFALQRKGQSGESVNPADYLELESLQRELQLSADDIMSRAQQFLHGEK